MSLSRIAVFAFGFFCAIGLPPADAAPGVADHGQPSALDSGTLVYGPEDALYGRMKGGGAY